MSLQLQAMPPRPSTHQTPLAVFDLDGTLLTGDSFLPFLVSYGVRRRRVWPLLVLPVVLVLYVLRLWSDRRAKDRLLRAFFAGQELATIAEHAEWFNRNWVAQHLRPELIARLREHQKAGHRVILLSASPDLYVTAIGRMLGIDEVVATRVATKDERCEGRIVGDNCKGQHKVEAITRHLGTDVAPPGSSAYGDSRSDLPILRWAERGFLVQGDTLVEVNDQTRGPGLASQLTKLAAVLFTLFGVIFCIQWVAGTLYFPAYKERPIGYLAVVIGAALGFLLVAGSVRQRLTALLTAWPRGRFLLTVFLVGFALRLAGILVFPMPPENDHRYYHQYAIYLLEGKGYGGIGWPTLPHLNVFGGPKAFFPPGQTFLLYGIYSLTGPNVLAGKVVMAILSCLLALVVYDIGRRATSEPVARWAAALTALCPTLVIYSASLGYETPLALVLACIADLALLSPARPRVWHVAAMGLLLGVGCLLKPICLLMPGLLFAWWLLAGAGWRAVPYAAGALLGMVLVVAPWTYRNYVVFDAFVPVSTNGGFVLWAGNNPNSKGIHMNAPRPDGEVDEVSMDRLRGKAAKEWILSNPVDFAKLAVIKTMILWGTTSQVMSYVNCDRMPGWQEAICMAILNVAWAALLIVCLYATWRGVWRQPLLALPILMLAYLFALHLVFEAHSRHHVPLVWVLLLVAAWGMAYPRQASTLADAPTEM